ncbi:MAG TPA: hypothetical protein VJN96_24045 [Vicinamibacterales bacterium]|nr:hypothetical protein [Vicinamibacterales bacterium]
MTSRSVRVLVLFLVVATAGVLAQGPPDFSGKWALDQADSGSTGGGRGARTGGGAGQGGGLGLGPSAENLTMTQTATSLSIEEHWSSGGSAKRVYPLDGRQVNNTLGAGRGAAAMSSSTWVNRKLVTTLSVTSNGSTRELQETRYLDEKGRLVVETMAPGRPNSRRSIYNKVK